MRGQDNHHQLGAAQYMGPRKTVTGFQLWNLGPYPAMRLGGDATVNGELYCCLLAQLPRLDRFEGHPELFRRSHIVLADGSRVESYIYQHDPSRQEQASATICSPSGAPPLSPRLIPSGDWRHR